MSLVRTGGRTEQYIMGDHQDLPPHNYGVRPWGVGFEMSPGQHDITVGLLIGITPLHVPPTDWGRETSCVTRPTRSLGTCLWRRPGSKRRRREVKTGRCVEVRKFLDGRRMR